MTINSKYVTAPSLQMVFRDKLTGLPLRSGYIKFWKDNARTTPKTVYKLSGTPPNYSFTAIGSTVNLTGIGTFSDNDGNDVVPYYLPYESESSDIVELYFIQVFDEDDNEQFTREGWPSGVAGGTDESTTLVNYIPNGQFALHTNLPEDAVYSAGEIRAPITDIAQGGWTFNRPVGATSDDFVTFDRFGSFATNPTGSPRYALRVVTENAGSGGDFKDVRIKFLDVNKFASNTQQYTLSITAKTNSGSSAIILFYYIKNYGTGGSPSPEEEKEIGSSNLTSTYQIFNHSFVFGANTSKTIGTNDDDFVQIAFRYPVDELFDISITDAVLAIGDISITNFPITTDAEFLQSLPGQLPIPAHDGSNLYLPLVLGPQGYEYDDSEIGEVRTSTKNDISPKVELNSDGAKYEKSAYSAYGTPYARLWAKWWNSTLLVPRYGTGADYATGLVRAASGIFGLHNNTEGVATATADGTAATGFTFAAVATGAATYYANSYWLTAAYPGNFLIENKEIGAVTAATVNSSFFTISIIRTGSVLLLREITQITAVAASTLANPGSVGRYFKFFSSHSGAPVEFFVWYKITNETLPVGGGTAILVNLAAADTADIVAQKTSNAINGFQTSLITATVASTIPASSFWTFNTTAEGFYVWYKKDGVGTDPAPASRKGILVEIETANDAPTVSAKTITAINSKYFATPNFAGMYLQGLDPLQTIDKDIRYSAVNGLAGQVLGTFQFDNNLSHFHAIKGEDTTGGTKPTLSGVTDPVGGATEYSGSYNARPRNTVVNFYIKY